MILELRVRAALATLELFGFNPHQRRDSRGRWVKMPTSELKRPRRGASRGSMKQLTSGPDRRLEGAELARVQELFGLDDSPTGIRTQVHSASVSKSPVGPGQQLEVEISLLDPRGQQVGRAKRTFSRADDGTLEVHHDRLSVDSARRNGGFSSRWLAQTEDRYREAGIKRITLQTTNVGGYAWAKAGFDFRTDDTAQWLADQVRQYADESPPDASVSKALADLSRRAASGGEDRPLPIEFAMLGWEPGATTWFGKKAMVGTDWSGVKEL